MNEIDRIHAELNAIGELVLSSGSLPMLSSFSEHTAKLLVIAGSSYFERILSASLSQHIENVTGSTHLRHFLQHQVVDRKFFQLFDFGKKSTTVNGFFSKFGTDYCEWA